MGDKATSKRLLSATRRISHARNSLGGGIGVRSNFRGGRLSAERRIQWTPAVMTVAVRSLHVTSARATSSTVERPGRIRVRKEVTHIDRVSGKAPWVQYLKMILTPESADYELTPEQLVGFANTLMTQDDNPPDVFYKGGWDPERALPNGKGTVTFADDT